MLSAGAGAGAAAGGGGAGASETPIDTSLSRRFRIGIGLLACVGFAIEPQFVIAYALLLAWLARSRRRLAVCLAAEHLTIAIGLAVYAVVIALVVPDYVRRIVPMAYVHNWIYGEPLSVLLEDWMVVIVSCSSLALILLAPWLTKQREWARMARTCAWLSVGLFIVFLVQRRSVGSHFLPARAFNFLAACFAGMGFARSLALSSEKGAAMRARLELAARTGVLTVVVLPALFVASQIASVPLVDIENARNGVRSPFAEPLIDLVSLRAAGKPIFVMSSAAAPAFPLVNLTGATWPYRFKSLAFVSIYYENIEDPTIAAYRSPAAQSAEERAFFDEVVDELTRTPLIVDRAHFKLGFGLTHFDFVDYYKQSPAFEALLQHYRPIARQRTFQVFEYQPPDERREPETGH
jgi:hypothetical protein